MDEIIERAARALASDLDRQYQEGSPGPYVDVEDLSSAKLDGDFDLRAIVRAVLQAIREPSDAMKAAALRERGYDGDMTLRTYQAMIDAALREGK